MTADQTQELVLRYWLAWQAGDAAGMRACLADEIFFDGAFAHLTDPDRLVEMRLGGEQLRDVRLIDSMFDADRAALLYSGRGIDTGSVLRIAEFIETRGGRILNVRSVTAVRPVEPTDP